MLVILIKGLPNWAVADKPPTGHVASKKSALKALKALKASFLRAGLPIFPRSQRLCYKISSGEDIALRLEPSSTGDKRDDILPTRYVIAIVPFVIRRQCPLAPVGQGFPVVWRFLSCQNCSIKRTH
jgi:hypothetical protein